MQLDFDTIKSITKGAVRFRQKEQGLTFDRCTEGEVTAWRTARDVLGDRAGTTCGIRLDFHTDAKSVSFSLASGNKVDVWINGILRHQISFDGLRQTDDPTATVPLVDPLGEPYAESRVTLWMPSHSCATLSFLKLEGATYVRPHVYRHRMLILGDSIAQGWNSKHDSMSYALRLAAFFDADCVNAAVGGGCFYPDTVEPNGYDPEGVLVAFGTNDFVHWSSEEEFHTHCVAYLDRVKALYPNKPTLVVTPTYRVQNEPCHAGTFADCRKTVADEAARRGFAVADGFSLLPPLDDYYAGDGLHPSELGFIEMAISLIPYVQKAFGW